MMYFVLLLSILFVVGFVSFSSKPSPIYGGLGLVVSGGVGCGLVLSFGGSFLGLMVFLVYLGGMLVVFGYTTAMATEEYPEVWGSNVVIFGAMVFGVTMEVIVMLWLVNYEDIYGVFCGLKYMEDWAVYSYLGDWYVRGDYVGVAALYSHGWWLVVLAGWALFISIFVVIEITRSK
uniref:NADH-ubiquinone oxidoreductase chain 6 n=1 Tax=Tamandua mexicana TaxID=9351 RepID=A0A0S2LMI4_TAMME|nr:NADH dehydrogenase subunit 6 [Tamandua mexicana]ALO62558.1 NADH dehydrogenase subunit 6 [Tamandua mexicana]